MHQKPGRISMFPAILAAALGGFSSMASLTQKTAEDQKKAQERAERSHKYRFQSRGRWFYGVAQHHGKSISHRQNRRSLGITSRQQRMFRKQEGRLPQIEDVEIARALHSTSLLPQNVVRFIHPHTK